MTVGIFGPALAYDHASKRGVAGVVCKVLDAVTGIPLDALNLDGSEAPVVTNSQGYVPEFALDPAPLLVIVEAGAIRMPMMNLSMVMDSSQAAIDAVQAAQDAAALVDAPADTVIKTLVAGEASQTRGALDAVFQKRLPLVTAEADGIMRKTDKALVDGATFDSTPNSLPKRNAAGNIKFNTVWLGTQQNAIDAATRKDYVDALAVGVTLPSVAHDLNDYVDPGIFLQAANAGAVAGTNYPMPYAGKLDVKRYGVITWQTYQGYQAQSRLFWRSKYNSAWSAWSESSDLGTLASAIVARQLGNGIYSVLDYGAVGNGTVDDTAAIQATCNAAIAAGGGAVIFPPKTYYMAGVVEIGHDLILQGPGATLIKKQAAGESSYAFFCTRSRTRKGYGTGGSRIRVHDLKFKGNFANDRTVCAFGLHHTRDFIAHGCTFEEMHGTGHIVDLAGCDDITLRDCRFVGATNVNSRAEAIQIDISAKGALSVLDDEGSHSGLPTINVTVDNCKFLPLTIGATTYPAPVPIGSHSQWEGKWYQNVRFINNWVEGARLHAGSADPQGIVHFSCIDGLTIENNTFIAPVSPAAGRVIGLWKAASGQAAGSNPNADSTTSAFAAPMLPKNLKIVGNTFVGFTRTEANSKVIYIDGFEGLHLGRNEYRNCASMYDVRAGSNLTGGGNIFSSAPAAVAAQIVNINKVVVLSVQGEAIDARGASSVGDIVLISNESAQGRFNNSTILGKGAAGITQAGSSTVDTSGNTFG